MQVVRKTVQILVLLFIIIVPLVNYYGIKLEQKDYHAINQSVPLSTIHTFFKGKNRNRIIRATHIVKGSVWTAEILGLTLNLYGHHQLGLPHYMYSKDYPQIPTMLIEADAEGYIVTFSTYPGYPRLSFLKVNKDRFNLAWEWPELLKNIYPAAVLFILLTWLELGFNVTMNPEATAALGILMFGLVFIPALLFKKKSFCRYACLVGRISGLYAMFSPVEIRSGSKKICDKCKTEDCFNGNSNGYGCPTGQNLKDMDKNTYCIMCAECFRTCPHNNTVINARPFGKDLVLNIIPKKDEAHLALIIFSITAFHGLTMTSNWKILISAIEKKLFINYIFSFTLSIKISLIIPIVIYSIFILISKKISGDVSYTYLFNKYHMA